MVVYAGAAGAVLEPTPGTQKLKIRCAVDALHAGGSTAGGEGLALAYKLAEQSLDKAAVNRVILMTDGDFNVGIADPEKLKDFVAEKRKTGIYLSVYGFGRGNYNDVMMQDLSQNGNGTAAYIDTLQEAQEALPRRLRRIGLSDRRRRQDPGRVQSVTGQRIPADRLRDPAPQSRGFQQRPRRRGRGRRRRCGDRALRDHARSAGPHRAIRCATRTRRRRRPAKSGEIAYLKIRYKLPGKAELQADRAADQRCRPPGDACGSTGGDALGACRGRLRPASARRRLCRRQFRLAVDPRPGAGRPRRRPLWDTGRVRAARPRGRDGEVAERVAKQPASGLKRSPPESPAGTVHATRHRSSRHRRTRSRRGAWRLPTPRVHTYARGASSLRHEEFSRPARWRLPRAGCGRGSGADSGTDGAPLLVRGLQPGLSCPARGTVDAGPQESRRQPRPCRLRHPRAAGFRARPLRTNRPGPRRQRKAGRLHDDVHRRQTPPRGGLLHLPAPLPGEFLAARTISGMATRPSASRRP